MFRSPFFLLLLAGVLIFPVGHFPQTTAPLVGTWEVTEARFDRPNWPEKMVENVRQNYLTSTYDLKPGRQFQVSGENFQAYEGEWSASAKQTKLTLVAPHPSGGADFELPISVVSLEGNHSAWQFTADGGQVFLKLKRKTTP